jgi:enediyne biosynthesis protein E4
LPGPSEYTNFHARAALFAAVAVLLIWVVAFSPSSLGRQPKFDQLGRKSVEPVLAVNRLGQSTTGSHTDASLPQLVDITDSTGIEFDHLSSPEQKYIVESMSGGVALIDYDRDGWPDIYFTNAQSVDMALAGKKARSALYHNNHDGTFTDVTDKAGVGYPCWAMGAVVGDYNNDGWPDLLVTCFGGVVLYRNNGDGTFTDVTKQAGLSNDYGWATGAAFGDYDRDGWVDLFVSHYVDFHLDDLPAFGSRQTCKYRGIDVQCGPRGLKTSSSNLYHNNGDGTFTDVSKKTGIRDSPNAFGLTAAWSDFDDDGHLDLFVANDAGRNYLFQNDGSGHFNEIGFAAGVAASQDGAEQANMGVALGDYLHTGRFSIAITHFSDEYAALFRNDGAMSFTDVSYTSGIAASTTPYVGWGDAFLDYDNSGWLDLFMVNGHVYPQMDTAEAGPKYREPGLLFHNQHNGAFKDISKIVGPALQLPRVSRGVAVGDLFNDGRMDIVIENLKGSPTILQPQGGPANHWVGLELVGSKSNRLALNARVKVTAGDVVQTYAVLSGGSYLSQNDLRIHVGLGSSKRADKVEIFWPAGTTEVLKDLTADHTYDVKEGEGIVAHEKIRPVLPKN